MKQKINKAISATNGKKTTTTIVLMLIVAAFGDKVPFVKENQILIDNGLNLLITSGLIHKVWRNRKEITGWAKSLFTKRNKHHE